MAASPTSASSTGKPKASSDPANGCAPARCRSAIALGHDGVRLCDRARSARSRLAAVLLAPHRATHAYFIVYGFALILLAVTEYFVSAKRFNDLGKPPAWPGLAPFCLLLAGAALGSSRARKARCRCGPSTLLCAGARLIIWNIAELGFGESRKR